MGQLIRLFLLQCVLALGLASASSLLSAAPVQQDDAYHCQDCPQQAASYSDCCLQVHSCSSCVALGQQPAIPAPGGERGNFAEPSTHQPGAIHAPSKPPPRVFLNS